jgi:chemotaxis-related protein WspB
MLYLIVQLGTDRYAIEAAQVLEVLPLVSSNPVPGSPPGMAGLFDYHGTPLPLIDLAEVVLEKPSRQWMNSRIILINHHDNLGGRHLVGLLAEHATETMRLSEGDFTDTSVMVGDKHFPTSVFSDAAGIVQRIGLHDLLSDIVGNQALPPVAPACLDRGHGNVESR